VRPIPSPASTSWLGTGHRNKAFTGSEWDPEIGLYYYRARYYDPEVGRFVSEDPIRGVGGIDPYVYVASKPTSLTDPSGMQSMSGTPNLPHKGVHGGHIFHCFVESQISEIGARGYCNRFPEGSNMKKRCLCEADQCCTDQFMSCFASFGLWIRPRECFPGQHDPPSPGPSPTPSPSPSPEPSASAGPE